MGTPSSTLNGRLHSSHSWILGIASSDKLFYLKKYVSGPALQFLEGTFYLSDEEAYKDEWNRLNHRYGQSFVVQRAFREKLSKWSKIQPRDAEGLRTFSDFLNAYLQAMPHVKGLEILSDEENQKLTQKTPDWLAARWNRQVTVACYPVTSLHALHSSNSSLDKRSSRETKANVFSTQTAFNND